MTDSVKPWGTPELRPLLIRDHVGLIHMLADPFAGQGTMVIAGFGEDPNQTDPKTGKAGKRLPPKVGHAIVGDVQQSLTELGKFLEVPHYNAYMPLAIFRPDLPLGTKGSERDVIASLGIVADFDDPEAADWAKRLPLPPNYVIETSAGRFQAFYFFDKPEVPEGVKLVAERLKKLAACDHGTSDISHVWRIPGALNWPNAKKVAEGRSPVAQFVRVEKPWDGERTSLQALSDSLPEGGARAGTNNAKSQDAPNGRGGGTGSKPHPAAIDGTIENLDALKLMLTLPPDLQDQIKQPTAGDRSKALFRVIARLIELDLDNTAIENLIHAHPKAIGAKYADREDLDQEIARVRAKTATRPVVQISGGRLPWVVDEAEQHLRQSDQELFQRGSLIVRPIHEFIPVTNGRQITGTRLAQVRLHDMRETFSRAVDFQKFDQRRNGWVSVDCPKDVPETYLQREGKWQLPVLTRIITAPTIRPDGSILEEPGYDAATGLLFEPQGVTFPRVPSNPDVFDVLTAITILLELLKTFPFVDKPSRAVAISAILTSLVRTSLPSAPLHAFTAPIRGSGKSLLVDVASMISTGHETPVMAQGADGEEFEKRLGAALIAGDGTISIDNCEQPLGGDLLCQVLTQPRVTIRILGQSKKVDVLTNATLFATGNNLRIKGDSTRRVIVCSLDPQCERPELRLFSTNVLELIRRDRPLYVIAALTILRYAALTALPDWCMPVALGSFERWSRWVRAAVLFSTSADPVATTERVQAKEPEQEMLATVTQYWASVIGDGPVSAAEVIDAATKQHNHIVDVDSKRFVHGAFRDALLVVAGNGGAIDSRRLGIWLSKNEDRIVGGKKISSTTMSSGYNRWFLVSGLASEDAHGEQAGSTPPVPRSRAA